MTRHEAIAMAVLDNHLNNYPDGLDSSDLLRCIEHEEPDIAFWEPFIGWNGEYFAHHIRDIITAVETAVETTEIDT